MPHKGKTKRSKKQRVLSARAADTVDSILFEYAELGLEYDQFWEAKFPVLLTEYPTLEALESNRERIRQKFRTVVVYRMGEQGLLAEMKEKALRISSHAFGRLQGSKKEIMVAMKEAKTLANKRTSCQLSRFFKQFTKSFELKALADEAEGIEENEEEEEGEGEEEEEEEEKDTVSSLADEFDPNHLMALNDFGKIDRICSALHEAAQAKLTPEQRKKYEKLAEGDSPEQEGGGSGYGGITGTIKYTWVLRLLMMMMGKGN